MEVYLYSVYDRVAAEYGPIFQAKSDKVAKRQYKQLMASNPNKTDYELVQVGRYDTETGHIKVGEYSPYIVYPFVDDNGNRCYDEEVAE